MILCLFFILGDVPHLYFDSTDLDALECILILFGYFQQPLGASMKLILILTFFLNSVLAAKTIDGVYECEGNIKKKEFQITINKDGSYSRTASSFRKNGVTRSDTDYSKKFDSNQRLVMIDIDKRERVYKKDDVTERIKTFDSTFTLEGRDEFPKSLKSGMNLKGVVKREIKEKLTKRDVTEVFSFDIKIGKNEIYEHPTLGKIKVWNVDQTLTLTSPDILHRREFQGKYHTEYGYIDYEENDFGGVSKDRKYYTEKCRLTSWK